MGRFRVIFWSTLALISAVTATGCDGGSATVTSPSIVAGPAPGPAAPAPPPPATEVPPGAGLPPVSRIIAGRVLDYDTDQPVGGARVSLRDFFPGVWAEVLAVTTSSDGRFNLTATTHGDFDVLVERGGYEPSGYPGRYDFSGDVALKAYRTLAISAGQSTTMAVVADLGGTRCGDDGFFWCRRVAVNAPAGQAMTLEVSAGDRVVVTDDQDFSDWTRLGPVLVTAQPSVWIVRFASYNDPPLRVTLQAR